MKKNKKTEEKIIFITRLIGALLFLLGLTVIFITAIIKSKQELPSNTVIYESASDNYYLDNDERTLLNTKENYLLINTPDEYKNLLLELETWSNELIINFEKELNEDEYIDDIVKISEIENYKHRNDERIKTIKSILNEIKEENLNTKSYIVLEDITIMSTLQNSSLIDICDKDNNLTIHIQKEVLGVVGENTISLYVIELDKETINDKNIIINYSETNNSEPSVDYKPIIYIYPEKEMNVSVSLGYKKNITVSYPRYENSWNVLAKPDGILIDNKTNRELYALYYESKNIIDFKVEEDGFVVKGEDSIQFLEEKLELLGLNPKEQEEFIIYWLPKLEENNYNYIKFISQEEIDKNMPLIIEPKPETTIRVLMAFKGLDEPINVKEQQLKKVERKGYTVVEWGGTIIK